MREEKNVGNQLGVLAFLLWGAGLLLHVSSQYIDDSLHLLFSVISDVLMLNGFVALLMLQYKSGKPSTKISSVLLGLLFACSVFLVATSF